MMDGIAAQLKAELERNDLRNMIENAMTTFEHVKTFDNEQARGIAAESILILLKVSFDRYVARS